MLENGKRPLPVGGEFFDGIIERKSYYVDKTSLITRLLQQDYAVTLFTRPRRFGKTLMMTTLQSFFETGSDPGLFKGLSIAEERELFEAHQGKYPVIFLTLKSVEDRDFRGARSSLYERIMEEFQRHVELKNSQSVTGEDRAFYEEFRNMDPLTEKAAEEKKLGKLLGISLKKLTEMLYRHHGKKAVVLIDEYDVPLDAAYRGGYYDEMVSLIRGMFGNVFKTNPFLERGVLTGCLRVSKESIFTGLNNFKVYTTANVNFSDCFGFTGDEVRQMLSYYGLEELYGETEEWYDGYRFGNDHLFCPWDVVNYVSSNYNGHRQPPEDYWINTSGNALLIDFIRKTRSTYPRELEELIAGEVIEKQLTQELTYRDLNTSRENMWSVLYMTGYLTTAALPEEGRYCLVVPNREVRHLMVSQIRRLFEEAIRENSEENNRLPEAFLSGNPEEAEKLFTAYLRRNISIRDTAVRREMKENFYHGYLLGILGNATKDGMAYYVKSNREAGEGYADIAFMESYGESGAIIEVKYAEDDRLDYWAEEALKQINERRYEEFFDPYEVEQVRKYGCACFRKRCRIVMDGKTAGWH